MALNLNLNCCVAHQFLALYQCPFVLVRLQGIREWTVQCVVDLLVSGAIYTRKLCYRKDDRAMRPIHGCPKKFPDSLTTPTAIISNIFHGLLFGSTLWIFLQNLKSVALPVPEIIGGTQKIWAVPGYAHAPFSPNFLMGFYSDWPCKCTRQIWSP